MFAFMIFRGHTAALTDCRWHPFKKSEFLTASNDGTVRIWDCARPRVQDKIIVMRSSSSGAKAITTAVTYSCDGKHIISGSTDGGIKFWDTSTSMRASKININAHSQHAHITDLDVLPGETFVYSRATDNTLKMWDTRMYSSPIANVTELYCSNEQTGIYFSPSGDIIVTGTSMNKQNESELSFFRTRDLSKVGNIGFNNCDVVSVCWSNKLNQIYAGLSSGEIKVFYDAHRGSEGITLSINKKIKPKAPGGVGIVGYDLNSCASDPTAQGLRIGSQKNRKSIRARKLEYRPELSSEGSGNTLKIGSNLLAPYIVKSIMEEARRKEDPREAILKYAEVSEKNPYWVSPAYRKNQPKPIFSSVDLDSSDEENVSKKRRK